MILIRTASLFCLLATFAAAQEAGFIHLEDTIIRKTAKFKVEPEYPAAARQFRISGEIVAEITIGEDGKVDNVEFVRGNQFFKASVVSALKKWVFPPFNNNGKPARVKSLMTFVFKM